MKILIFSLIFTPLLQASQGAPGATTPESEVKRSVVAHATVTASTATPVGAVAFVAPSAAAADVKTASATYSAASAARDVKASEDQSLAASSSWVGWHNAIEAMVNMEVRVFDPLGFPQLSSEELRTAMRFTDDLRSKFLLSFSLYREYLTWYYACVVRAAVPTQNFGLPILEQRVGSTFTGNKPIDAIAKDAMRICIGSHGNLNPTLIPVYHSMCTIPYEGDMKYQYSEAVTEQWMQSGFTLGGDRMIRDCYFNCSTCDPQPADANRGIGTGRFLPVKWVKPFYCHALNCRHAWSAAADELGYSASMKMPKTGVGFLFDLLGYLDGHLRRDAGQPDRGSYNWILERLIGAINMPQWGKQDLPFYRGKQSNISAWREYHDVVEAMVNQTLAGAPFAATCIPQRSLVTAGILSAENPFEQADLLPSRARAMLMVLYTDILAALRPKVPNSPERVAQEVTQAIAPCAFPPEITEAIVQSAYGNPDEIPPTVTKWGTIAQAIAQAINNPTTTFPEGVANIIAQFAYYPTVPQVLGQVVTAQTKEMWEKEKKGIEGIVQEIQRMYPIQSKRYVEILNNGYTSLKSNAQTYITHGEKKNQGPIKGVALGGNFWMHRCTTCTGSGGILPTILFNVDSSAWRILRHNRTCPDAVNFYIDNPNLESRASFMGFPTRKQDEMQDALPILLHQAYCDIRKFTTASEADKKLAAQPVPAYLLLSRLFLIESCVSCYPELAQYCKDPASWTAQVNERRKAELGSAYNREQHAILLPPEFAKDANAAAAAAAGKK